MQLNEIHKAHHKNYLNNCNCKTDNFIKNSDDNNTEITRRVLTTEDRKSKCTQEKSKIQIIDGKKSILHEWPKGRSS